MDPKDYPQINMVRQEYHHRKTKKGTSKDGPYWYGFWYENGKSHRVYIGKELPPGLSDLPGTAIKFPGRRNLVWPGRAQAA